jgi:hypothetical protein
MGGMRSVYKISVTILESKRPFGRPKHTLEEDIRMDLTEVVW